MDPAVSLALLASPGRCRVCGSTHWTRMELNITPDQDWRCYPCFDHARHPDYGKVPLTHGL